MKVQLISKAAALLLSSIPEGDEIASTVFYSYYLFSYSYSLVIPFRISSISHI